MEAFTVSTVLGLDDWRALSRAASLRQWSPPGIARRLAVRAPLILIFLLLLAGLIWSRTDREVAGFLVGMLGTLLLFITQGRIALRQQRPTAGGLFLGPARFEFSAAGIHIIRTGSDARLSWERVRSVDGVQTHVFIWLDQSAAYVIPARDLTAGLTTQLAVARLGGFLAQAQAGATAAPAEYSVSPPPLESRPAPPRVGVAAELGATGKLLILLRADASRLVGNDAAIALLGVIALVLWLPLDGFIYEGPMEFMPDQAGGLACVITGAMALAWILARLSAPRIEFRRVLLIVTGASFIAIAGSTAFSVWSESYFAGLLVLLAVAAYAMLYFKRALTTLSGLVQTRALLVGAAATFCFIMTLDRLEISPSLWVFTGYDDADLDSGTNYQIAWRRFADLQFDQRARIDAQIAHIATQSAAGPQVYFVGFAGYGEQHVFSQEIDLAAERVAARYGSQQREIRLVNDQRDLARYPLATVRALHYTLDSLGKVMDADDVLFLALSSHGDDDATLAVSNAGMMPADLDVDALAAALRDSGVKWKVIVISACYAGSFIDRLADDHTIVLAAAAADRTSFGCADDRDLTYFGEAFYRDALPKAASLRAAFETAKASIAAREKAEGVEPSNPQASFGAALEGKLSEMKREPAPDR